ncbi:hypothetical protein JOB18_046814 [Solea senegalensis]|uniref:Uncharacterized protein n=1 Tax=Solea senegalensis TaxID=28829 RepID=A0AAV6QSY1_SOLSE|nr:hypothetical protein JOB18_046814 [Solea senegalensis]
MMKRKYLRGISSFHSGIGDWSEEPLPINTHTGCGHGLMSARIQQQSAAIKLLLIPASWRFSLVHHGSSSTA